MNHFKFLGGAKVKRIHQSARPILYNSLALPYLSCCLEMWGSTSKTSLKTCILQKKSSKNYSQCKLSKSHWVISIIKDSKAFWSNRTQNSTTELQSKIIYYQYIYSQCSMTDWVVIVWGNKTILEYPRHARLKRAVV